MLAVVYGNSPHDALAAAIPGLQPWQMKSVPRDYWKGREGRARAPEATRWLLEEIGLVGAGDLADPSAIANSVDRTTFIEAGLGGMLASVYGSSRFAALSDILPELRPW